MRAALLLVLAGCAGISKERGHDEVAALVQDRTGFTTGWAEGTPAAKQISDRVDALLDGGVTRAGAVQIALINNPALQATYEELGIAQAEMAHAGMLSNPSLGASVGIESLTGPNKLVEVEISLVQSLLDLFMLPARRELAAQQFSADTLRIAQQAMAVAADVSEAFIAFQASQRLVELRRSVAEAESAAADLAGRQRDAGNLSELALATRRATAEQARLDLSDAELESLRQREAINTLLGLWGARTAWTLGEQLPEVPASDPPLQRLESLAVRRRVDLESLRQQQQLMEKAAGLARSSWLLGTIQVGVHGKREVDGASLVGPSLVIELPIFDQRGAMISRLEAQQRRSERQLAAASITARSQVRAARAQFIQRRQRVEHFNASLLPLRARIVELSQEHYNGMFIGAYELLAAKREQVEGYAGYLQAIRDYWLARAALERAIGGSLAASTEKNHVD